MSLRAVVAAHFATALLCLAFFCGCSSKPKLYPVKGTVTVDGEPAARLLVLFYRVDDASPYPSPASALTDDKGEFVLSTAKEADGAFAGEYAVVCRWHDVAMNNEGEPVHSGPDKLNGRYGDRKSTPVHVTVRPGAKEPISLKLNRGPAN